MSSPTSGSATLRYDDLLERARKVQRRADRHLIVGSVLIGRCQFRVPFFSTVCGSSTGAGEACRFVRLTTFVSCSSGGGAMNTLGAMIDVWRTTT
jgi:hypothetical protein